MAVSLGLVCSVVTQDVGELLGMVPDLAHQVDDTHQDLVQVSVLENSTVLHHDPLEASVGNSVNISGKVETITHRVKSDVRKIVNLYKR